MSPEPRSCPSCGAPLLAGDDSCPFCGEVLGPPPPAGGPRPAHPTEAPSPETAAAGGSAPASEDQIAAAATAPPPWERRRGRSFFSSLWLTWRESVLRPVEFFRRLPPRGGYGAPLGYAVLITAVAILFNIYWGIFESVLLGAGEEGAGVVVLGGALMGLVWMAFFIPIYVGLLFAMVGVLHVSFLIIGAGRRGFEASFRGVAYSSGPAAFSVFPFFGPLLGAVWGTVLLYVAMREVQRTTNGRAVIGFLLPMVAFIAFFVILAVLLVLLVGSAQITPDA